MDEEFGVFFREASFTKNTPKAKRRLKIDGFSVLFFDLDNFKSINDTYGHDVGDKALEAVAGIMRENVRNLDVVGRWGGEEFVVALIGADENEAYKKAEELRNLISEAGFDDHTELKLSASVGVASLNESDAKTLADLIEYADKAMYEAKTNRGKNNAVKFSELGT